MFESQSEVLCLSTEKRSLTLSAQCQIYYSCIRETVAKSTGGMKVKNDRDESSPYAALLAAQDVAAKCKTRRITALHIKLRATGGNRYDNCT